MEINPKMRRLSVGLGALLCALFITGSSRATVVAVIDTGIDARHPALQGVLWTNPGESGLDASGHDRSSNHIDDDGNGFVDDVHGWNFANHSNDLSDHHGHGTHVAGLIVGAQPADFGRLNGATKLMILKYFDPDSSDDANLRNTVQAIAYANRMGAQIINYSGGGLGRNPAEEAVIQESEQKNILFIAAAGNERSNSDTSGYYPADYGLTNILSVAAVDRKGTLIPCSNYGAKTVHVAAQGNKVLSTVPGGGWERMTGTSQAAALVSGIAAQLLNERHDLRTPTQMIQTLIRRGAHDENLSGKTRYQVRLDPFFLERI